MIIHSAMPLRTFDLRGEVCYEGDSRALLLGGWQAAAGYRQRR
jgi:hypothetical protein